MKRRIVQFMFPKIWRSELSSLLPYPCSAFPALADTQSAPAPIAPVPPDPAASPQKQGPSSPTRSSALGSV